MIQRQATTDPRWPFCGGKTILIFLPHELSDWCVYDTAMSDDLTSKRRKRWVVAHTGTLRMINILRPLLFNEALLFATELDRRVTGMSQVKEFPEHESLRKFQPMMGWSDAFRVSVKSEVEKLMAELGIKP